MSYGPPLVKMILDSWQESTEDGPGDGVGLIWLGPRTLIQMSVWGEANHGVTLARSRLASLVGTWRPIEEYQSQEEQNGGETVARMGGLMAQMRGE